MYICTRIYTAIKGLLAWWVACLRGGGVCTMFTYDRFTVISFLKGGVCTYNVHGVFVRDFSPRGTGLLDPDTSDGRVIFFLPWEGKLTDGVVVCGFCIVF